MSTSLYVTQYSTHAVYEPLWLCSTYDRTADVQNT